MNYRTFGKTGWKVSEISLGTWQVGGKWGSEFNQQSAEKIIHTAIDQGIDFIDTADVYSNGLSEAAVARVVKSRSETVYVATKCGRQLQPHVSVAYTPETMIRFVEQSLRNMKADALDLIQLHCPPTEVYYRPEIFETFDRLQEAGKIRNLGVSVEKVEEALKAIEYPNVKSVQIIFNIFRQRPLELFFKEAQRKAIGVIARVPLASGLLTGAFTRQTTFEKEDHRFFNRQGARFDKGETFAGMNFENGLDAVSELKALVPKGMTLAALALKWILMHDAVSCIIPGASQAEHIERNVVASAAEDLSPEIMQSVKRLYESKIKPDVHHLW